MVSTKKLAKKNVMFDPMILLDNVYASGTRSCSFDAADIASARAWQRKTAKKLADCIGFLNQKKVPLESRIIEAADRGDYIRKKVIIRTTRNSCMPLYLLVPKKRKGKLPCVMTFAGHGYGVKDIIGLWEDGAERFVPDGIYCDFACEIAKRGFVVIAPEISCFGERSHDYSELPEVTKLIHELTPTTCHNIASYAIMLGKSALGIRVWDAFRAIDYLQTVEEADTSKLGVMGISGGGMHAFFSTALDRRIKACVVSGYFCNWRHSILSMHHCTCNFVPGLLNLGELSDLAGLIAPRPCLVENGTHDPIFPIKYVKDTVNQAKKAWKVFGAGQLLQTDYFDGRHRINGAKAYKFLSEHLA